MRKRRKETERDRQTWRQKERGKEDTDFATFIEELMENGLWT
jgi:hypothetical protein